MHCISIPKRFRSSGQGIVQVMGCLMVAGFIFSGAQKALCAQADWNAAGQKVQAKSQTMLTEAKTVITAVAEQRNEVTAGLETRRTAVSSLQERYDALVEEFEGLLAQEEALSLELADEQEAVKALEGAIRQAAKEADAMISDNPLTAVSPERRGVVAPLLDDHAFPGLPAIQQLVGLYFQEIELSAVVTRRQGTFIGRDGLQQNGQILHAGPFTTCYRTTDGDVGFLTPNADGSRLIAVAGYASTAIRKQIAAFMDRAAFALPVDVSSGAVFQRLTAEKTWLDWLQAGGILVWPILMVGAAGLLLGLERFITLGTKRAFSNKRMAKITGFVQRGDFEKCKVYCGKGKNFPACRVLGSALAQVGQSREVLENVLQEAILRELPRLERFLPTMNVLAAIAPLLGLLGTVTGMINTFQVITVFGTGDPRMMSGGISEALVTTQLGLAVAIPIMVLHHFLERRVDAILGDMEQKGTAFTVSLLKAGAVVVSPVDNGRSSAGKLLEA